MKKVLLSIIVLIFVGSSAAIAQKNKFGHINSNQLLQMMPERDSAKAAIEYHAKELEQQLQSMQTELETKYSEYIEKQKTYSDIVKKTKEEELTQMQQRVQNFQTTAQQDLQTKEQQLLKPIIEKAQNAIQKVSKSEGYTYVFDTSTGAVLYWPEKSDDLLPLVKKELGIE